MTLSRFIFDVVWLKTIRSGFFLVAILVRKWLLCRRWLYNSMRYRLRSTLMNSIRRTNQSKNKCQSSNVPWQGLFRNFKHEVIAPTVSTVWMSQCEHDKQIGSPALSFFKFESNLIVVLPLLVSWRLFNVSCLFECVSVRKPNFRSNAPPFRATNDNRISSSCYSFCTSKWRFTLCRMTMKNLTQRVHVYEALEVWMKGPGCLRGRETLEEGFHDSVYDVYAQIIKSSKMTTTIILKLEIIIHFCLKLLWQPGYRCPLKKQ